MRVRLGRYHPELGPARKGRISTAFVDVMGEYMCVVAIDTE